MANLNRSGDPVAAVTEAEASGEIASIYADIRATTGVPVVNLIWRHLATMPGALPWAWSMLQPLYASGAVARAASHLRASVIIPDLPVWPIAVLESAGLSPDDRQKISRVLRSYDCSNAMNLAALGAMRAMAAGQSDPMPIPPAEAMAAIVGELPRLLTFDEMDPATADVVMRLNAFGDPEHRVVASMYRHLAHWPPFLALAWERLSPLAHDGRIDEIIAANLKTAGAISQRLAANVSTNEQGPEEKVAEQANAAIDLFIRYAIGRMVPIGRLLAAAFPAEQR
jgi:hypothetical protein